MALFVEFTSDTLGLLGHPIANASAEAIFLSVHCKKRMKVQTREKADVLQAYIRGASAKAKPKFFEKSTNRTETNIDAV